MGVRQLIAWFKRYAEKHDGIVILGNQASKTFRGSSSSLLV